MNTLDVTHRTPGGEAYLIRKEDGVCLLYDRHSHEVTELAQPGRLARRGSWLPFDGDPEPILEEVRRLLPEGTQ